MASTRKKFNAIALASYWLSQIKISESVAKHSISLAFFKLALEAGCEVWLSFLKTNFFCLGLVFSAFFFFFNRAMS